MSLWSILSRTPDGVYLAQLVEAKDIKKTIKDFRAEDRWIISATQNEELMLKNLAFAKHVNAELGNDVHEFFKQG